MTVVNKQQIIVNKQHVYANREQKVIVNKIPSQVHKVKRCNLNF
jgi:hypothetical protein